MIKNLGYLLGLILMSVSLQAHAHAQAQDDTEALASAVVHLLVTTSNGSQEGSGVIVSPDGVIFTAAHVVEDASEIRVEFFDGFETSPIFAYYARIQYISTLDNFDFAILEIFADDQSSVDSNTLNLPYIQSWSRAAVVREPIEIFGYPESADGVLYVTNGIVGATPKQPIPVEGSTQDRFTFYLTNAIVGMGDSGGLVINSENEFVGIPINWENDEGGYVATILPIVTICKIYSDACGYEPDGLAPTPTNFIAPTRPAPSATLANVATPQIFSISSRVEGGTEFVCAISGNHRISIVGGAYNTFGNEAGWWRTVIYVFNGEIVWDNNNEPFSTISIGNYQSPGNTRESAQTAGLGQSAIVYCNAGETLRLVTVDTRGSYQDLNNGEVSVSIEPVQ